MEQDSTIHRQHTPALLHSTNIAALGRNSYTGQAAVQLAEYYRDTYGTIVSISNHTSIQEVWSTLYAGSVIVLPFVNSSSGIVRKHWKDMIEIYKNPALQIIGDISYKVRMCLCGLPGADSKNARTVVSHWAAVAQCSDLIGKSTLSNTIQDGSIITPGELTQIQHHMSATSTDQAIMQVANQSDTSIFALGSQECAEEHHLQIFNYNASNLPYPDNVTRMLLVQKTDSPKGYNPSLPHHGLFVTLKYGENTFPEFLRIIAQSGANIVAIHKRTMRPRQSETQFFIELNTTQASNHHDLAEKIFTLDCSKKTNTYIPTWHSWSDTIEPTTDWSFLHQTVEENVQYYSLTIAVDNQQGVIATIVNKIHSCGVKIVAFNTILTGHNTYAFKILLDVEDAQKMHSVLHHFDNLHCIQSLDLRQTAAEDIENHA